MRPRVVDHERASREPCDVNHVLDVGRTDDDGRVVELVVAIRSRSHDMDLAFVPVFVAQRRLQFGKEFRTAIWIAQPQLRGMR